MPGCDFTRRDLLRWTALCCRRGTRASAATTTTVGIVLPVNLELVTLAEDHAVMTWFTGLAGTDDGIGQMVPAPANGEVRYGTRTPRRLNRVAYGIESNTPYHYVELTAPRQPHRRGPGRSPDIDCGAPPGRGGPVNCPGRHLGPVRDQLGQEDTPERGP